MGVVGYWHGGISDRVLFILAAMLISRVFPVAEAVLLGAKNAAIAGTVVAVPTVRNCFTVISSI